MSRASAPAAPVDQGRLAAAADAVAALHAIEGRGDNLVTTFLAGRDFVAFEHYPEDDRIDAGTGAQVYFHAHHPGDPGEAGHLHCFLNPEGKGDGRPIHHLAAIGLDATGRPVRLFTVNHWVVEDDFLPAAALIDLLPRFRFGTDAPEDRFVTAMFGLFGAEIAGLIAARDRAIARFAQAHPDADALADRRLEVTSKLPVDLPALLRDLRESLPDPLCV